MKEKLNQFRKYPKPNYAEKSIPKVGVISIHPAPYRDPVFNAVYRRNNVEIEVLTMFEKDAGHFFGNIDKPSYPNAFLGRGYLFTRGRYFHPKILSCLKRGHFDAVVIPGHQHITCIAAMSYCLASRMPIIYSGDSMLPKSSRSLKGKMRGSFVRYILKRSASVWVPGKASYEYMKKTFGVSDNNIFCGCYTLDFGSISEQVRINRVKRNWFRKQLKIQEHGFIFLMVGNFIPTRDHEHLVEAFSRVVLSIPDAYLILVGEGKTKTKIKNLCKEKQLANNVRIIKPVPFDNLSYLYPACDVYVHSGSEPYSTALAYAAIAGLPIISVNSVGACQDYLLDGKTGYLVSNNDVSGWATAMIRLAQNRTLARNLGENGQNIASKKTLEWASEQFESAVVCAIRTSGQVSKERL